MYRYWIVAIPVLVVAAGCKKSPEPVTGEGPFEEQPSQWEPVEPAAEEGPLGEDQGVEGLPEAAAPMDYRAAIAQLRDSTDKFRSSTDMSHEELVRGLRALGDAVASLPEVEDRETYRTDIRTFADQIQVADPTSMDHVKHTKDALQKSANMLEKVGNQRNLEGFDTRMTSINDQIKLLDAGRPLLEQREVVAAALTQMTEVLEFLSPERTGTR